MTSIELYICINETFIPVLLISIEDCNRFAVNPLSRLRFLGYTFYGGEGHISAAANSAPVNYQSAIEGGVHYYFTSSGLFVHVGVGVVLII